MDKREEIKEAVKSEVIKLMAQELKQDDSFKKLQNELASELFSLEESKELPQETQEETQKETSGEPKRIRSLNSNWGYDPINKKEENAKKLLGFLFNPEDIKKGFVGQEITQEEADFMKDSSFTKLDMINELKEKIAELTKELSDSQYKKVVPLVPTTAAEKLNEFKKSFYGTVKEPTSISTIIKSMNKTPDFSNDYKEQIFNSFDKPSAPPVLTASTIINSISEPNSESSAETENPRLRKSRVTKKKKSPEKKQIRSKSKVTAAGKKAKGLKK